MKFSPSIFAALLLRLAVSHAETAPGKLYAIPSWGDYTLVYGPGTDPAMDSPEAMERMLRFWKGRGYTGVFLRSDLQQFDPFVRRNPRVQMNPSLALFWRQIDVQAEHYDYVAAAQKAADKIGFELWVYHPHIYSDGAPEEVGVEGLGRMVPWSYVNKALFEHPEMVSIDRQGHKYWMVPEYAYPEARRAKVGEFVHMAKKYGVKRFIANMRSEVNQLIEPADKADRFGFNEPVVAEMRRLHGVDILTDPRFDADSPAFDPHEPLVEAWRDLRGSYLTQLYRELRAALREVDPGIKIAITLAGEHIGPPLGNWRTDWRTWVDEGLVDYLVSPVFFEATLDPDAGKKGYLTNALAGIGTISHEALRAYIQKSKHPEIGIIATGGPPYFWNPPPVPAGADGWQCDVWLSSYHLAWFQRWEQWMRDLREFGHIKFLEQNFDAVSPEAYAGISGGWGLAAYDPKVRACPGAWWRFGNGADARPFAQAEIRHGTKGQAVRLIRAADGSGTLTAWHNSSPDRSRYSAGLDTAITNGVCTFEYWLFRQTAQSALTAYLQGDGTEVDVGLRVAPASGKLSYASGLVAGTARWTETGVSVPVGEWAKLTMRVDLDRRQYSAVCGDAEMQTLCEQVPLVMPKERFVEMAGVNVPIAVPVYKQFQRLLFVPEGATGSVTYIDDVSVKWQPTLHFVPRGPIVELSDDFEIYAVKDGSADDEQTPDWRLYAAGREPAYRVTNGTSFGQGVKSLQSSGGAKTKFRLSNPFDPAKRLVLDFDLFVRSSGPFPYIVPSPAAKSPHRTGVSLVKADGTMIAGIKADDGTWRLWNGHDWSDTGVRIDYDVWNHLQIALDGAGSYRAAVQPIGQVAAPLGRSAIGASQTGGVINLQIDPSGTPGHISCYDNILITSGTQ